MHRSGTSAVTRTISAMGAALPHNLIPPMQDNSEGFFESADIVAVHDRFLEAIGSAWNDPRPIRPEAFGTEHAAACRADLLAILRRDFPTERLFVIKDPRICVLMPMWRRVLAKFGARPYVVFAYRNPEEVAQSLSRRNEAGHEHGLALWLTYNLLAERDSRDLPRVVVSYDAFLDDPAAAAKLLTARLDCFDPAQVAAGVELARSQWKSDMRNHESDGDNATLPPWVATLYRWLCAEGAGEAPPAAELDAVYAAMATALELYGPIIGGRLPPAHVRPPILKRVARRMAAITRT